MLKDSASRRVRALNANEYGSAIEVTERSGGVPVILVSTRKNISCLAALDDGQVILGLSRSGHDAEVCLVSGADGSVISRVEIDRDPKRLLMQSGRNDILVLCENAILMLDRKTLEHIRRYEVAERVAPVRWSLHKQEDLNKDRFARVRSRDDEVRFLNIDWRTAIWREDGILQNLTCFDEVTERKGFFNSFTLHTSLEEIDLSSGQLVERPLPTRHSRRKEIRQSEFLGFSPDGRKCLVRHWGNPNLLQREKGVRGVVDLFKRQFRDTLTCAIQIWDTQTGRLDRLVPCAEIAKAILLEEYSGKNLTRLPFKSDAPLAPVKIADPSQRKWTQEEITTLVSAGQIISARWIANDRFVVLLRDLFLREVGVDGTCGQLLQPEVLPRFELTHGAERRGDPYRDVDLFAGAERTVILETSFAQMVVELGEFRPTSVGDLRPNTASSQILFDALNRREDFEKVRKRAVLRSPTTISIQNIEPASILSGIEQMTERLRERYSEFIVNGMWTPKLKIGNALLQEQEICNILLEDGDPSNAVVLSCVIAAFLDQLGDQNNITDEEVVAPCLTETVTACILLSPAIPGPCVEWVKRRDQDHDAVFRDHLEERIVPELGVEREDVQRLVARVAVQDFSTGSYPGSLLKIGAMPKIAELVKSSKLTVDVLAKLIIDETLDQADGGGLSCCTKTVKVPVANGFTSRTTPDPQGLLAEVIRRLNRWDKSELRLASQIGSAIRERWPEAGRESS